MTLYFPKAYKLSNLLLAYWAARDHGRLSAEVLGHRAKVVDMIRIFHRIPSAFPRHSGPRHVNQTPGTAYEGNP